MLLIIWKQKKTLLHKSAKFLRFLLILMIWIISNIPLCWDFRNAICNCFLVSNKRTAVTTEHPNILKNLKKKTRKWQFLKQLPTYVSNMLLSKSLSDIVHLDPPLFLRRPFGDVLLHDKHVLWAWHAFITRLKMAAQRNLKLILQNILTKLKILAKDYHSIKCHVMGSRISLALNLLIGCMY